MRHLTTTPRTTLRLTLTLAVAASLGCSAAAPDGGDSSGETTVSAAAALNTGLGVWSWGTVDGKEYDIGSADSQTCFLSGVAGDLDSGYPDYKNAFAGVRVENGHYMLQAFGGTVPGASFSDPVPANKAVNIHVSCTGIKSDIRSLQVLMNNKPYWLGAVTPARRCFLESVTGGHKTWSDVSDYVSVWNDGKNWFLQGLSHNNTFAFASAVCLDFPAGSTDQEGGFGQGKGGVITSTPGYDTVCGLTGFTGAFTANSWTDGVMIDWPKTANDEWTLTASPLKSGNYHCVH
jgi:hypothetical protein